jgi:hypothetical protein
MVTEDEKDVIGEVIAEDAAIRRAMIGVKKVNSSMSNIDELRQQLADVSHERDLLRAALGGEPEGLMVSFEDHKVGQAALLDHIEVLKKQLQESTARVALLQAELEWQETDNQMQAAKIDQLKALLGDKA